MGRLKRSKINFTIKTWFQIKLILNIMVIVLASTAVTCTVFYFNADHEIGSSLKQFHITARNFQDYLGPSILFSALFGLLVGIVVAIFFPHKFAGPMFRIERDLSSRILDDGDLTTRFNLRDKDEYKDIAESLNSMLQNFESTVREVKSGDEKLSEMLKDEGKLNKEEL
ncbi:MAG: hypothetical protein ACE5FU_08810, partial [Nitrospinota bacterium]